MNLILQAADALAKESKRVVDNYLSQENFHPLVLRALSLARLAYESERAKAEAKPVDALWSIELFKDLMAVICPEGYDSEEAEQITEIIAKHAPAQDPRDSARLDWMAKSYGEAGRETEDFYKETLVFDRAFADAKKRGLNNSAALRGAVDVAMAAEEKQ
jgi:hypothetical protein